MSRSPAKKKAPAKHVGTRKPVAPKAPAKRTGSTKKPSTAAKAPAKRKGSTKPSTTAKTPAKRAGSKKPSTAAKVPAKRKGSTKPSPHGGVTTGDWVAFLFAPDGQGKTALGRMRKPARMKLLKAATGGAYPISVTSLYHHQRIGPVHAAHAVAVRRLLAEAKATGWTEGVPEYVRLPEYEGPLYHSPEADDSRGTLTAEQRTQVEELAHRHAAHELRDSALAAMRLGRGLLGEEEEDDDAEASAEDDAEAAKAAKAGSPEAILALAERDARTEQLRIWHRAGRAFRDEEDDDDGVYADRSEELREEFEKQVQLAIEGGHPVRFPADDTGLASLDQPPVLPLHREPPSADYHWRESVNGLSLAITVRSTRPWRRGSVEVEILVRPPEGGGEVSSLLALVHDRGTHFDAEVSSLSAHPARAQEALLVAWCKLLGGYGVRGWIFLRERREAWFDSYLARGWFVVDGPPSLDGLRCAGRDLRQTLVPGIRPNPGAGRAPALGRLMRFLGGR